MQRLKYLTWHFRVGLEGLGGCASRQAVGVLTFKKWLHDYVKHHRHGFMSFLETLRAPLPGLVYISSDVPGFCSGFLVHEQRWAPRFRSHPLDRNHDLDKVCTSDFDSYC